MYQAPDFIKVGLQVKTAFANTSSCPYDEGTDHTMGQGSLDVCDQSYATYIDLLTPKTQFMCYSVQDE